MNTSSPIRLPMRPPLLAETTLTLNTTASWGGGGGQQAFGEARVEKDMSAENTTAAEGEMRSMQKTFGKARDMQ